MRILLDLTDLYDHLSGIERYAMELSKAMMDDYPEDEYILVFKNEIHKEYYDYVQREGVRAVVCRGSNKLLFRQVILPFRLYSLKADAYVFLAFPEPVLFFNKIYVAVHDMTCFDAADSMKMLSKWYYRISNIHSFCFAKRIITISKFSARRILSITKRNAVRKKLALVYCGVSSNFSCDELTDEKASAIRKKYRLPDEYILSLSTLEPRKNLELLLNAYEQLRSSGKRLPRLVLAGRKGWKLDKLLNTCSKSYGKEIVITDFIEEEDLPYVYKLAKLFVFPSKYEGFGMPPLEAMAMQVPVLSSDSSSMPEILGEGAFYFNNDDVNSLMDMLLKLTASENEIAAKRELFPTIVNKYSWQREAGKLARLLHNER